MKGVHRVLYKANAVQEKVFLKSLGFAPVDSNLDLASVLSDDTPEELVVSEPSSVHAVMAVSHPYPWEGNPPTVPLVQTSKLRDGSLNCDIARVLELRVAEGFDIEKFGVRETRKGSQVNIICILNWQPHVKIQYAMSSNRAKGKKIRVSVELSLLANYEFLQLYQQQSIERSSKQTIGGRLNAFLQALMDTDRQMSYLLTHMNSPKPTITLDPGTQESEFWILMGRLGTQLWHRSMKVDSLNIILKPTLKESKPPLGELLGFAESDPSRQYDPSVMSFQASYDSLVQVPLTTDYSSLLSGAISPIRTCTFVSLGEVSTTTTLQRHLPLFAE